MQNFSSSMNISDQVPTQTTIRKTFNLLQIQRKKFVFVLCGSQEQKRYCALLQYTLVTFIDELRRYDLFVQIKGLDFLKQIGDPSLLSIIVLTSVSSYLNVSFFCLEFFQVQIFRVARLPNLAIAFGNKNYDDYCRIPIRHFFS